jgi:hypothetical protein
MTDRSTRRFVRSISKPTMTAFSVPVVGAVPTTAVPSSMSAVTALMSMPAVVEMADPHPERHHVRRLSLDGLLLGGAGIPGANPAVPTAKVRSDLG